MTEGASRLLTFLLTDIEGSTRLWEAAPDAMRIAVAQHDALVAEVVSTHGGTLVKPRGEGDSSFVVFDQTADAVRCAASLQERFTEEAWPPLTPIRVRMGVHCGQADWRDGDYYGDVVNRCARLRSAGHGGQILLSQAALDAGEGALDTELEVTFLGDHRLQDLARSERVWQLNAPGLQRDFPPLRGAAPRRSLPLELTSFVGRGDELATTAAAVRRHPLVTLTGAGGVGKTRLATRVAATIENEMRDGVRFADLASVGESAAVLPALSVALDIQSDGARPLADAIRDVAAQREMLVLLDNCEHLLDAAADAAALLVGAGPNIHVLATSREPLRVAGELVVPVAPLALPDAEGHDATASEAVQLFCDRMRSHGVPVPDDDAGMTAIATICRRIDGIPLAIEFAAARTPAVSLTDLLDRLDKQLALLAGASDRRGTERQRTMEATIDWSYQLLQSTERAVLDRLSVFRGGFTLGSAAAVCADVVGHMECLDVVSSLVAKSMVAVQERGHSLRYRLLESIGEFAHGRLAESGAAAAAQERLTLEMIRIAEDTAAAVGTRTEPPALQRLRAEWRNVAAALSWCLVGDGPTQLGVRLAAAPQRTWARVTPLDEARHWLALARDAAEACSAELLHVLVGYAEVLFYRGDNSATLAVITEALDVSRKLGHVPYETWLLYFRGLTLNAIGDVTGARAAHVEAAGAADASGNEQLAATVASGLARVDLVEGRIVEAEAAMRRSLDFNRRQGNLRNAALSQGFLAVTGALRGDAAAVALADEARELAIQAADSIVLADVTKFAGLARALAGRVEGTSELLATAIIAYKSQGRAFVLAEALEAAEILAGRCGDWQVVAMLEGAVSVSARREVQPQTVAARMAVAADAAAALGDDVYAQAHRRGSTMSPDELAGIVSTLQSPTSTR